MTADDNGNNIKALIARTYQQAKLLGACELFTGRESTVEEMAALLRSPQGSEFCIKHSFPNLATLRGFKTAGGAEAAGVYIDAGDITLTDPESVVLAGRTRATITCTKLRSHVITLLYGSSAVINAGGWAVVKVHAAKGTKTITNTSGHAVLL